MTVPAKLGSMMDAAVMLGGLRFGIMCSGTVFQRWQAECIEQVLAVPGVEAALLIVDGAKNSTSARTNVFATLADKNLLWKAYKRNFVRPQLRSEDPVELGARLADVPQVDCVVERRGKYSQFFAPTDIERVREYRLDFILQFAFDFIRGDMLGVPRYGVWSFHHDDLDKYRGLPACFWEIVFNDPITGVTLQRLTEGIDNGVVLRQGWFKTIRKSYPRNRDAAFSGSTGFPARVCRDLSMGEGGYVDAPISKTSAPVFRAPGNAQMAKFGARLLANKLEAAAESLFKHDQWGIGIVDVPIWRFLDPTYVPDVRWLPTPPRGTIAADPFAIRRNGRTCILYEQLDDRDFRGRIMAIEVPDDGQPILAREVIESPVHMSYPYLIEDGGEIYCIPEMAQSGELVLFRAIEFPWHWERAGTMLRGVKVLDASVFRHEGRWWMLGMLKGPGECIELHGWHAPDLVGPWVPHACNPLKVDVRGARPGGTPFVHAGALYRPAQDLSVTYGGRLVIQRIDALTPARFREEPVAVVAPRPDWPYPAGLHTLSAAGDKTVLDAKRHVFSPREFWLHASKFARLSRPTITRTTPSSRTKTSA